MLPVLTLLQWTVGAPAAGCVGGRHCTADQYSYVPLGRNLVYTFVHKLICTSHRNFKLYNVKHNKY